MAKRNHPGPPIGWIGPACLFVLSLAWTSVACAPVEAVTCPASVTVTQEAQAASGPWSVSYSKLPHELQSATIYEGPIQNGTSLVFDEQDRKADRLIATWHLDSDSSKGYWLACSYERTSVILSRPLPREAARCTITYSIDTKSESGLPAIKQVDCR